MPALSRPTYCPYCKKIMQAADAPEDLNVSATPGAINICIGCTNISIFDQGMNLRRPTFSEFNEAIIAHGDYLMWLRKAITEARAAVDSRDLAPSPPSRDVN